MSEGRPQALIFTYHKSGTSLFAHVMDHAAAALGLTIGVRYGKVWDIDPHLDIVRLPHSLLGFTLDRSFRAIRVVRDPRDIWLSGYLYHRHCQEAWCVNADLDPTPPIQVPRVDHAFQHRPERWKRRYLERLGGKSYQRNLLDRDRDAGLAFELEGYTACTLEAMRDWSFIGGVTGSHVATVRLEDLVADYDAGMLGVFRHLGFTEAMCATAVRLAQAEDMTRMDGATLAARPQIHSQTLSKWRDMLSPAQIAGFEQRHGDLIMALGYQPHTTGDGAPRPG
jgi:hypothetical protein